MEHSRKEILAAGQHLQLLNQEGWEYADRIRGTGVVAIIAVTSDDHLVLTEQFRVPVNKRVIDLPAGLVGDVDGEESEAFESAAERELLEETGFRGRDWTEIFTGPSSAGMTSELITFFLVREAERVAAGGGDESETIDVHVIPLARLERWLSEMVSNGSCIDPKVYAALGILALRAGQFRT